MFRTPNYDAKVKAILDATKPGERTCALTGEKWMMDEEEIGWYKKFNIPPSKLAPTTRVKQMISFWGPAFRLAPHAVTGKPVITTVHPGTGLKVLPDAEWHAQDFSSVHREIDLTKSFFDQWHELRLHVPHSASRNYVPVENSISIASRGDVDSYFMIASKGRNNFYGIALSDGEQVMEAYNCRTVSNSRNILFGQQIFGCQYIRQSSECINSFFLFDCRNCENCFGAWNQRNKKYLWWNEQLSENEWKTRMKDVDLRCRSKVLGYFKKFQEILGSIAVWPENFNTNTENSTGEYLTDCRDCHYGYFSVGGANNTFWDFFNYGGVENCAFCGSATNAVDSYCCPSIHNSHTCLFSSVVVQCQGMEYSYECYNCENCFGCISLKNKKFHIFNKPYSEEEYWKRVDELKCAMLDRGEYGEFFPIALSANYYMENGAAVYWGVQAEELRRMGALELDPKSGEVIADTKETRRAEEIPDCVDMINPDQYTSVAFVDSVIGRKFSLLKPEVELCKKLNMAPDDRHQNRRVKELVAEANIGVWIPAECAHCKKQLTVAMNNTYKTRKIYCRPCYLKYLEELN